MSTTYHHLNYDYTCRVVVVDRHGGTGARGPCHGRRSRTPMSRAMCVMTLAHRPPNHAAAGGGKSGTRSNTTLLRCLPTGNKGRRAAVGRTTHAPHIYLLTRWWRTHVYTITYQRATHQSSAWADLVVPHSKYRYRRAKGRRLLCFLLEGWLRSATAAFFLPRKGEKQQEKARLQKGWRHIPYFVYTIKHKFHSSAEIQSALSIYIKSCIESMFEPL